MLTCIKNHIPHFIIILLSILSTSCAIVGPEAISRDRLDYNVAIEKTNNEQLLLNLVRLQYRDTPFFMKTTGISTSFAFETETKGVLDLLPSIADKYQLSPRISYTEKPTITYTPLQGQDFIKQMLSPIELHTLLLLYHSGWSIERLLRVTGHSINNVLNAPTASGPTPKNVPEYQRFREVTEIVRKLQQNYALSFNFVEKKDRKVVMFTIVPEQRHSLEVQKFKTLLNLAPDAWQFELMPGMGTSDGKTIYVSLRSLLASLFYLSQAVDILPEDREAQKVTTTRYESGQVFDWHNVMDNLFHVHTSLSAPESPYVAIQYRGKWFYIRDDDLESKSTFSLLTQLLALQSGDVQTLPPLFTIPVN